MKRNEWLTYHEKGLTYHEKGLTHHEKGQSSRTPLAITRNKILPKIGEIICKHWGNPVISFRRKKKLKDLIGQNKIINYRILKTLSKTKRNVHSVFLDKTTSAACKYWIPTFFKALLPTKKMYHFILLTEKVSS